MRFLKKTLALLLTLVFCFGLVSGLAYAEDNDFTYLAIGDSTSQGYCTEGFTMFLPNGIQTWGVGDASSPNSYPFVMQEYLNRTLGKPVTLYQYTLSGLRPNELCYILDPEGNEAYLDGSSKWHMDMFRVAFSHVIGGDIFELYPKAVEEADLITYECGLNNVSNYLTKRLLNVFSGTEDTSMYCGDSLSLIYSQLDPATAKACDLLKEQLSPKLEELLGDKSELVQGTLDTILYSYASFLLYFDRSIDLIYEMNDDVELVLFGMCNYIKGFVMSAEVNGSEVLLDFSSLMQTVYDSMNIHITTSEYADRFKFVDMSRGVETVLNEIASGNMTDTTKEWLIKDIKDHGITDEETIEKGIEAYEKAASLETLDFAGIMEVLSGSDMNVSAKNCILDYENASIGDKSILNIYLRAVCANAFGSHPSTKGCLQKFELLKKAYESDKTASDYAVQSAVQMGSSTAYTVFQMIKLPLLNKLSSIFDSFISSILDFFRNAQSAIFRF